MTYLYLDVDGVLADFIGGCERLFERRIPQDRQVDWHFYRDWGLTDRSFWNAIREMGREFWEDLAVKDSGRRLVKALEIWRPKVDITFLTAPAPWPEAVAGRIAWLQRHFPQFPVITCPTGLKHRLAAPGRALIDDNEETCSAWELLGGQVLVWPAPTNRNWMSQDEFNLTAELRKMLAL
jgi:5'(3')-deoxyribonucleotidase